MTGVVDRSPFVFTGGSDQRIRYWDLGSREHCSMVVPANRDYATGTNFSYEYVNCLCFCHRANLNQCLNGNFALIFQLPFD